MNLNKKLTKNNNKVPTKRLVQAGAVTLALTTMLGAAAINGYASTEDKNTSGVSGIIASLYGDDEALLSVSGANVTSVGLDSESASWILSLMANVEDFANVYTEPNEGSAVAGKLRRGDMARVESLTDNGFYKITSGNLTGYIKQDISLTGQSCKEFATAIGYNGSVGITLQEEAEQTAALKAAAEEAARKEAAAKASSSSQSSGGSSSTQKESYGATTDEVTLLAAIIEKEAGGSGYQGMLAVGSVVMNRVRSSSYPNTIEGVIGQKGQFTGGIAGLSGIISRGPSSTAIRAAEAALAGEDIVGGKVSFRSTSTGHSGTVIGDNVFF